MAEEKNSSNMETQEGTSKTYASYINRSMAFFLDTLILSIIRSFIFKFFSFVFLYKESVKFTNEFTAKFGVELSNEASMSGQYFMFWLHSPTAKYTILLGLLMIVIGSLYYSLLQCSSWSSTIGGRMMNIYYSEKDEETRLTFLHAFIRYFVALTPWIIANSLMVYQLLSHMRVIHFTIHKSVIIFLVLIAFGWFEMVLFNRRKLAAHDVICGTVALKGRKGSWKIGWKK